MSCLLSCAHLKYTEGQLENFAVGQQIKDARGFDDVVLRIRLKGEVRDKASLFVYEKRKSGSNEMNEKT